MSAFLNFIAGASTAAFRACPLWWSAAVGAVVIEHQADTVWHRHFSLFYLTHAAQNRRCFLFVVCLQYIALNTLLRAHCSSCKVLAKMPFCGSLKVFIKHKDECKRPQKCSRSIAVSME